MSWFKSKSGCPVHGTTTVTQVFNSKCLSTIIGNTLPTQLQVGHPQYPLDKQDDGHRGGHRFGMTGLPVHADSSHVPIATQDAEYQGIPPVASHQAAFTQKHPHPGWCEQDPMDIW
eukprot:1151971-Pelagomonas_calceolata.AAC.1